MKRVLGASRLSIIETFRPWCTPDHIMVLPVPSLATPAPFDVTLQGTTAVCFDCNGLWAAGYVNQPGTYTQYDLLPKRSHGPTRYAPFRSMKFTMHQLNEAVRKRIEWLREPFDMNDYEFERTRTALYIVLCHTPELARLRELEQARTDTRLDYPPRPPFPVEPVTRHALAAIYNGDTPS